MVDTLIISTVFIAIPLLLGTLWLIYKLGNWWADPFGRLVFGSLATLKLWVVGFLVYVAVGSFVGGLPRPTRQWINLAFGVGIVVQSAGVAIGLYRYLHQRGTLGTTEPEPQEEADALPDRLCQPPG